MPVEPKINTKDVAQLERTLQRLNKQGIPYAVRFALDKTAFDGMREAKVEAKRVFTMRNTWTERSIQVNKVPKTTNEIHRMASEMGSRMAYMGEQEKGFTRSASGSQGVQVPTAQAAGQGDATRRTRPVKKQFRWSTIRSVKRRAPVSSKQATFVALTEAIKARDKIVFMRLGRVRGFWQIRGRIGKDGRPIINKLALIWNANRSIVKTSRHRWMEPAAERARQRIPANYNETLSEQVNKAVAYHNSKAG